MGFLDDDDDDDRRKKAGGFFILVLVVLSCTLIGTSVQRLGIERYAEPNDPTPTAVTDDASLDILHLRRRVRLGV